MFDLVQYAGILKVYDLLCIQSIKDAYRLGYGHQTQYLSPRETDTLLIPMSPTSLVFHTPVFLLDVSEDLDMLCSYLPPVPQQVPSACIQQALIRHVGKHKALGSHEI